MNKLYKLINSIKCRNGVNRIKREIGEPKVKLYNCVNICGNLKKQKELGISFINYKCNAIYKEN